MFFIFNAFLINILEVKAPRYFAGCLNSPTFKQTFVIIYLFVTLSWKNDIFEIRASFVMRLEWKQL